MIVPARSGRPIAIDEALDRPVAGWPAFASGGTFAWACDSKSVLFLAGDRGIQALYRATANGKRAAKALDGERQIKAFSLAPDGKWIAITAVWPSEPWELYAASLVNGRRETNLSHANDDWRRILKPGRVERLQTGAADGRFRSPDPGRRPPAPPLRSEGSTPA